jgi:hypothetical protein
LREIFLVAGQAIGEGEALRHGKVALGLDALVANTLMGQRSLGVQLRQGVRSEGERGVSVADHRSGALCVELRGKASRCGGREQGEALRVRRQSKQHPANHRAKTRHILCAIHGNYARSFICTSNMRSAVRAAIPCGSIGGI